MKLLYLCIINHKQNTKMEKITCSNCHSIYELTYINVPIRDKDSIFCKVCNVELFSWNESAMYSAKLIETRQEEKPSEEEE